MKKNSLTHLLIRNSILFLFCCYGCAFLPKGTHPSRSDIQEDLKEHQHSNYVSIDQGRPLFIKVNIYPQVMSDGHILKSGKILMFMGREKINLSDILQD